MSKPSSPNKTPDANDNDAEDLDGILSSLDFDFEPADLGPDLTYTETEEDIEDLDQDLSFYLPQTQSEEDELHWAAMYANLGYWAANTLSGPAEPPYNGEFLIADHHEEWSQLVSEHERLCILAPRDHGKSWVLDKAYPIWMAWRNPGKSGFIFSATQDQASRILGDIKEEIETNPRLADLLPKKRGKNWNQHALQLANGHTIYARGFGTRVRGAHPVWIVCDDVLNDESAYSETTRAKQIAYFKSAVSNMCVPGGQIVVIGTPFHSADLYGELKEMPAYFYKRYSAIKADGTPLWPERYSLARLLWKRDKEIGPLMFAREYQCEPVADDISLFPSYLFKGNCELHHVKLGMPYKFWKSMGMSIYMGVDFAISSSASADFTVIFVMGVQENGDRWIIDIFKAQGMPYRLQKSKIIEYGRRYHPDLIFLESNQMQRIFGDEIIMDTDLPIKKFTTLGVEKHSLAKGIPSMRTLLEGRKIKIPRGDERSVRLTNEWIAEMGGFVLDGGKVASVTKHDDMAMASWICDQAIRAGGKFSASWTAQDVYSEEEMKAIKEGRWTPTLEGMVEDQMYGPTTQEESTDLDGSEFGASVQIVSSGGPEPDFDDDEEVDDPFTGQPLPSRKRKDGDWRPRQQIPIPHGGGWFR